MASLSEFNRYGEEIEKLMLLRTSPISSENAGEGIGHPGRSHQAE